MVWAESVYVLKLNWDPGEVVDALESGAPLGACRLALEAKGLSWRLPGGACNFVRPSQHAAARRALNGERLHSTTVVVSASFEHLVAKTLQVLELVSR